MTRTVLAAICVLLAACSDAGAGDAPGPATPSERKALEEAAEMLKERRAPPVAATPTPTPTESPAP